ncbi:MAG: tRNA-dihydrouridine synthase, partial [Elusimicrobiota bacterium]
VRQVLSSGCRGAAIGRAAIGEPDIFNRIISQAQGMPLEIIPPREKIKKFLEFVSLNVELYGEPHGIVRARKVIGFWLKGVPKGSFLRAQFMSASTLSEVKSILVKYT